jgi:hypothetical protein
VLIPRTVGDWLQALDLKVRCPGVTRLPRKILSESLHPDAAPEIITRRTYGQLQAWNDNGEYSRSDDGSLTVRQRIKFSRTAVHEKLDGSSRFSRAPPGPPKSYSRVLFPKLAIHRLLRLIISDNDALHMLYVSRARSLSVFLLLNGLKIFGYKCEGV